MPRRAELAAAALVGCALLAAPASAAADGRRDLHHHRLLSFRDPEVLESSGLVDEGRLLYTVNDSGDGPVVYAVDARTGETAARTTYSSNDVEDVEALAPGPGGAVWVGDIGDNRGARDTVSVYRAAPLSTPGARTEALGGGDPVTESVPARRYDLAYPDGPRDAEALLVDPGTGRVFVVSKSVFGGTVYAAPRHLRAGVNTLRPFARVDGLVTDGAFFPDGRHVVLRTYGDATVYTFPDFRATGRVRLPSQPQGEGISVGPDGRVLLSSEGVHSYVVEVSLPARLTAAAPAPGAAPSSPRPSPAPSRGDLDPPSTAADWWGAAGVAVLLAAVGFGIARVLRRPR